MALSVNSVFEVRTAGNDTNGGGFVTGASGTDFSQQDAKNTVGNNISTTDAVAVGTGVITSVTASFTAAMVGNIIYLQGGTGTLAAGWYQVTVFTSATSITVDRNVAAGTGITMNIGGALASLGMAGGVGAVDGNSIWVKAGTYTVTSASTNVAAGCFSATIQLQIEGYQTTRGDLGTAPLLQASGISTFVLVSLNAANGYLSNLSLDGAGLTSSRGTLARGTLNRITALNCTNNGIYGASGTVNAFRCRATGCSTQSAILFDNTATVFDCVSHDNTISGFDVGGSARFIHCLSYNNSGATSEGFRSALGILVHNCVAYNNGRDGFRFSDLSLIVNCIAEANAGFGYRASGTVDGALLSNCAGFNNTSGNTSLGTGKAVNNYAFVTGSATFFTNAAGADFSLNTTAGGGAAARAAGYPGVLPAGGTGFLDIGVLQHADPASGGGANRAALPSGLSALG